jgi:glycosyltransferase involved in cell wall biosynthesis
MRTVHTIPAVSSEASGPTYSVTRLCETLQEEGVSVVLATLKWDENTVPKHFHRQFKLGIGPRKLGSSPPMKQWLRAQALAGNIEILHNHSLWMMPNVYPGRIAEALGIPYIVSPRGTLSQWALAHRAHLKKLFWAGIQGPSLRCVTGFHATSENEFRDIRKAGFHQPVAVISNGIDIPKVIEKEVGDYRTLLYLGRFHKVKGIDMLLHAWSSLQHKFPDWRLRIVGVGEEAYYRYLRDLGKSLGLTRITMCGPFYGDRKFHEYAQADLYVLPSHSENFGVSVAESLASGTPTVVTTATPWGAIRERNAGWACGANVKDLEATLQEAMKQDPVKLSKMGEIGRKWMIEEYSWASIAQKMQSFYAWVLNGGATPDFIRDG